MSCIKIMSNKGGNNSWIGQQNNSYQSNICQQTPGRQLQKQIQQQQEKADQTLKYTIQQDMLNVLGIATELSVVLDHFQNDEAHPIVSSQWNRLITQLNLSHSVHYDLEKDPSISKKQLDEQKKEALKDCEKAINEQEIQLNQAVIDFLKNYYIKKNLQEPVNCHQPIESKKIISQGASNFNVSTVSKVLSSMQQNDQIYAAFQNGGQYIALQTDQIKAQLKSRQSQAEIKLKSLYPNQQGKSCIKDLIEPQLGIEQESKLIYRLKMLIIYWKSNGFFKIYNDEQGKIDQEQENQLNGFKSQLNSHLMNYLLNGQIQDNVLIVQSDHQAIKTLDSLLINKNSNKKIQLLGENFSKTFEMISTFYSCFKNPVLLNDQYQKVIEEIKQLDNQISEFLSKSYTEKVKKFLLGTIYPISLDGQPQSSQIGHYNITNKLHYRLRMAIILKQSKRFVNFFTDQLGTLDQNQLSQLNNNRQPVFNEDLFEYLKSGRVNPNKFQQITDEEMQKIIKQLSLTENELNLLGTRFSSLFNQFQEFFKQLSEKESQNNWQSKQNQIKEYIADFIEENKKFFSEFSDQLKTFLISKINIDQDCNYEQLNNLNNLKVQKSNNLEQNPILVEDRMKMLILSFETEGIIHFCSDNNGNQIIAEDLILKLEIQNPQIRKYLETGIYLHPKEIIQQDMEIIISNLKKFTKFPPKMEIQLKGILESIQQASSKSVNDQDLKKMKQEMDQFLVEHDQKNTWFNQQQIRKLKRRFEYSLDDLTDN